MMKLYLSYSFKKINNLFKVTENVDSFIMWYSLLIISGKYVLLKFNIISEINRISCNSRIIA